MIVEGDHQRDWLPDEPRQSRLVFIGRDLNWDVLRQSFEACADEVGSGYCRRLRRSMWTDTSSARAF
jgi:hypothetical protein